MLVVIVALVRLLVLWWQCGGRGLHCIRMQVRCCQPLLLQLLFTMWCRVLLLLLLLEMRLPLRGLWWKVLAHVCCMGCNRAGAAAIVVNVTAAATAAAGVRITAVHRWWLLLAHAIMCVRQRVRWWSWWWTAPSCVWWW